MAREIDEKATRKAMTRIRRAQAAVERAIAKAETDDPDAAKAARVELSDWETEFMTSVEQRLSTYGSAFADPTLGEDGEALSRLQIMKLKEIEKKAKGKGGSGFKRGSSFKSKGSGFGGKSAPRRASSRDINADIDEPEAPEPEIDPLGALEEDGRIRRGLSIVDGDRAKDGPKEGGKPKFRVIDGGKDEG
ncbi:hypothetical protein ACWCOP_12980 [Maricaulaceae bacterium MS644]